MPTWVAFNPGNWRHLAVSTQKELTLWNVEQSNDRYYVTKRFAIPVLVLITARVLASQAEAIVDLRRTWPQHRIDIH